MASLDWIKKTVNTAGLKCPHIGGKKCPGHRAAHGGCAFWLDEIVEHTVTTDGTAAVSGCGILWHYAIQYEVRDEAIRTQAGLDKVATEIRDAATGVTMAARGIAASVIMRELQDSQQRALNGAAG